ADAPNTNEGDSRIKAQLVKMAQARAFFRRPALDTDGNRAMRIETVIGWRDELHYPGNVTYIQRPSWDASPLGSAAATLDPQLVGYAQQMFADNQFFASVQHQMEEKSFRATIGLLEAPDDYEIIKAQPPSPARLPMSPGQPDFAFTDEEDGVVALKHGDEILYVSLYWRAQYFINSLARVHYQTPRFDRTAVVRQDMQSEPSGLTVKRGTDINAPFAPWTPGYPPEIKSAHTGEEMPIAKLPPGVEFQPNRVSPFVGKADFYRLRYGPYLIGMNTTKDKTFELQAPADKQATELVSGWTLVLNEPVKVRPMSTVVLYLPGEMM
ncbi:MAG: hypothetical protein M3347_02925, partial [Armatimonadota bacterium]|nr:hypothetical protein [Armatimonadota bacterium]